MAVMGFVGAAPSVRRCGGRDVRLCRTQRGVERREAVRVSLFDLFGNKEAADWTLNVSCGWFGAEG